MTQMDNMRNVAKLLEVAGADPRSKIIVGAIPVILAGVIHGWKYSEAKDWSTEERIAYAIEMGAIAFIEVIESNGLNK